MLRKISLLTLFAAGISTASLAQDIDKGYLTGRFETNTNYYANDGKTNATVPDGHFGSNNYLKLDYYKSKFAIGVQLEAYAPALVGYPNELEKAKLTNYYVSWTDDDFSITAGSFYEQFGSGLLFRAWEDRALGLNNAIMGARFTYNYKDLVSVKAIWGMPRFGMEYSDTQVRGADISFSLSNLLKWQKTSLSLEASALNRTFKEIPVDLEEEGGKSYNNGFSGRINLERSGFSMKAEYVDAGNKFYENPRYGSSEQEENFFLKKRGNAQLLELGYNRNGLGINLTGRRLEWMDNKILYGNGSTSNLINYVPAMCTQYTYMLTTLHPYTSMTSWLSGNHISSGEMGAQLDVYYNFKRGTAIGGKRGMKVHANFSTYYTLDEEKSLKADQMLFRDFSIDIEKQWSRDFKMLFLYSAQEKSTSYGANKNTMVQNIFVTDMQYKFTPKLSARMELQYLLTHEEEKDWMAALLEINFAPKWSIYGSDMYNHGSTKIHYYNAGVSYAKSRTRVALSYGRFKAGYICSGGVCRTIPAYTGANLSITTSF